MKLKENYKKVQYGCNVEESVKALKHNLLIKHFNNNES